MRRPTGHYVIFLTELVSTQITRELSKMSVCTKINQLRRHIIDGGLETAALLLLLSSASLDLPCLVGKQTDRHLRREIVKL